MQYRENVIQAARAIPDAGQATIDLDVRDPLTTLLIQFALTNGGARVPNLPPEMIITRIELVDGGRVLWSLTGAEAVAAACYERYQWPNHWYDEQPNGGQNITIPLDFGRWIGDPDFAFDPTKYQNPQLRVTWARNALHATGTLTLGVIARLMEGLPAPSAVLCWKSVRTFVSAAAGIEPTEMPVDGVWRKMMVRAYLQWSNPTTILTRFQIDCDGGKFIPLDLTQWDFLDTIRTVYPLFHLTKLDNITHGDWRETWFGGDTTVGFGVTAPLFIAQGWCSGNSWYIGRIFDVNGVPQALQEVEAHIQGSLPQHAFVCDFGTYDDPNSWFPAPSYRGIKLNLTQGVAGGAVSILTQQPVMQ